MMGRRGIEVRGTGPATSGPGGVSNSGIVGGDITTVHVHGREPVPWPHKVGVIPRQAEVFQERAEAEQLRTALANGATAVLCRVLHGTGGVGKTQLAADYARRAWRAGELDVLVWISASSRPAIISAYAQAAEELLAVEPGDPERAAERFLALLDRPIEDPVCRWLVVLDDVTDPADLKEIHPPESPHGRTLVTTRRRDAALPGERINLGMFTPEQATAYVTESLARHGRQDDMRQIGALAQDLDYLPLALSQAAAYLIDTGLNCRAYRELLADRTARLEDLEPDALPDDQPYAVHAAWSLSIERANQLRPAGMARPMLQLAAMLDPNGIPRDVLTSQPALDHLTTSASLNRGPATVRDAERALSVLHRLSLIDHTPDTPHQTVRIHQLIQRAVRDALPNDQHDQLARTTADALLTGWPEIDRDTTLAQALRANTEALTRYAPNALWQPDSHPLLLHAGTSLGDFSAVGAVSYYQHLVDTARRLHGPDHPAVLIARNEFAYWLGNSGNADGAAAAFAELLEDVLRLAGPDHPQVQKTRNNLAFWLNEAGDPLGALAVYKQLLTDRKRLLGPDHPDTLGTTRDIFHMAGEIGDAASAATNTAKLLDRMRLVLGRDHAETLTAQSDLARWRGKAGDADGALAAYRELLDDRARLLGPDHPKTLQARQNAAHWQGVAGDADGALTTYSELLEDMLRLAGPDHPKTLQARQRVAFWQGVAGDADGALTTYSELLEDMLRLAGPDHPETLNIRQNLAIYVGMAGDSVGATTALIELLVDRQRTQNGYQPDTLTTQKYLHLFLAAAAAGTGAATTAEQLEHLRRVLGPDHPTSLTIRDILATSQGEAGDAAGAATAYAELARDRARVLGPDHPDTLTTRGSAAHWRGEAGDAAGAAAAGSEVAQDRTRVLGPDHPHTLTARANVAHWQGLAGDADGAAATLAELLKHMLRVLGPYHPHTLATRANLAEWRANAGDVAGAAAAFRKLLADYERVLGPDHPDTLKIRQRIAHAGQKNAETVSFGNQPID
ncbi:tetratricopeptide repeat protein [Streptomyces sp. NPDC005149]